MKDSDLQFNGDFLRELILKNFGLGSIKDFCKESGIGKRSLYDWFDGNRRAGPRPASLQKIIEIFAKKNIHLSVSDFYILKSEASEVNSTKNDLVVSEPMLPYGITTQDDIIKAKAIIAEKNQIIAEQYKEILSLKEEIENLKKRLKGI